MNLRDLWDVDWLIEPLYDAIDHQLAAIIEQVDDGDEEWFDVDDARQHAETLFGIAFVAAQTYAARTVEDLNNLRMRRHKSEKKKEIMLMRIKKMRELRNSWMKNHKKELKI